MARRKRVSEVFPEEVAQWKFLYEAGMTIEELSLETGYDKGTTRRALHDADTKMRPPGQRPGTIQNRPRKQESR